jgi:hypothetical protein
MTEVFRFLLTYTLRQNDDFVLVRSHLFIWLRTKFSTQTMFRHATVFYLSKVSCQLVQLGDSIYYDTGSCTL